MQNFEIVPGDKLTPSNLQQSSNTLSVKKPNRTNAVEISSVSSRMRESLYELHAHVDFVFRDTISCASNISSISSKKTKYELEKR